MAGRIKNLNGGGPLASVSLTNQLAAIGSTLLWTPAITGMYRVNGYLVCRTSATGGASVGVSIAYTDSVQAQTDSPNINQPAQGATLSLATTGTNGWFTMEFYATSGNAINWSTTFSAGAGAPAYDIFLRLESV